MLQIVQNSPVQWDWDNIKVQSAGTTLSFSWTRPCMKQVLLKGPLSPSNVCSNVNKMLEIQLDIPS